MALKGGARAIPQAFALTFTSLSMRRSARARVTKRPLGPRVGALKLTSASGTRLPSASVTVTASRIVKRAPAGVDCVAPAPGVSLAGLPARLRSAKLTGVALAVALPLPDSPAPEELDSAAVAVNGPVALLAVNGGELATPAAPVVSLAWVAPPRKLAPALELLPHTSEPPPPAPPSVNVTVLPATGLPSASSTWTCSGWR